MLKITTTLLKVMKITGNVQKLQLHFEIANRSFFLKDYTRTARWPSPHFFSGIVERVKRQRA